MKFALTLIALLAPVSAFTLISTPLRISSNLKMSDDVAEVSEEAEAPASPAAPAFKAGFSKGQVRIYYIC